MFDRRTITLMLAALPATGALAADDSLRDPTRPDTATVPAAVEHAPTVRYVVSAIFYSSDRRVAVVNGRAVSVGDRLGAARVVAIGPESLTLDVSGRHVTAKLAKTTVRR